MNLLDKNNSFMWRNVVSEVDPALFATMLQGFDPNYLTYLLGLRNNEILEKIAHLEGLEIEIIGVWVWVSGNTRTYKDLLKAEKFIWQKAKEKWVFMGKKSNGRGTMSMDEMREKYGSEKVEIKPLKTIKC